MITKVPNAPIENIDFGDETIILNGAPTKLSGTVQLRNTDKTNTRVRYIGLKPTTSKSLNKLSDISLYMNTKLRAGETKLQSLTVSLPLETPPGTYHQFIEIKGKKKQVQLVVQPSINVAVQPNEFTLQGTAPGTKHSVSFTVLNRGNLDFQIPNPKHVAALDMDMLCRAFGFGVRDRKANGFNATMDQITQHIKEQLPNWASAKIAEAGQIIKPGKQMLVTFSFVMPKEAQADNDYDLNVRFWDQELSFVIKSHQEPKIT
ncbi:hypothetical protein [Tamlana crocina]|uniref:Uncharacterized protein n=1 Tax=Tamlana crocina TaxID=393006 RepID=A0ABX1D6Q9_9FLAO|nr:hypothetical protein [Tamlana crocina]NJX13980.1 hypothetical protein [Tamlana crocina]